MIKYHRFLLNLNGTKAEKEGLKGTWLTERSGAAQPAEKKNSSERKEWNYFHIDRDYLYVTLYKLKNVFSYGSNIIINHKYVSKFIETG